MNSQYYTVIIPIYNQKEGILKQCLQSVYNNNYPLFELIVVNDGSSNQLQADEQLPYRLINLPERRGSSFARNAGAKEAQYERLVFIDSDVVVPEVFFRKLNEFFDNNPLYCCVSAVPIFSNCCTNPVSQYYGLRFEYYFSRMGAYARTLLSSCLAVKKDCFFKVGGFDEQVPSSFADDIVLGWRLFSAGHKLAFDKQVSFKHLKVINFLDLTKMMFLHSCYYSEYYFKYHFSKDSYAPAVVTKGGVLNIVLMGMLISVFLIPLYEHYKIFLTSVFLLLILINNKGFLQLIRKKAGSLFSGFSILIIIWETFILFCGSILGTGRAVINKIKYSE